MQPQTIKLKSTKKTYFISKSNIRYFEDPTNSKTFHNLSALDSNLFKVSKVKDLFNQNLNSSYWLKFKLKNESNENHFRIELYDFDIDEIEFYTLKNKSLSAIEKTGFLTPFSERVVQHKNPGIDVFIDQNESLDVFMKIKSSRINILKPVVKHYSEFVSYSLKEYLLLGLFNGLLLLILTYNLIYFFILRTSHYLYYVLYGVFILLYLNTQNGIGFQFLWYNMPHFNLISAPIFLSFSIIFILLFCKFYLQSASFSHKTKRVINFAIVLKLVLLLIQLNWSSDNLFNSLDFLFFQLCLALGFYIYKKEDAKIKWFINSFLILNLAVFISFGEKNDWITSTIFTVYILNIGVIIQFICLSIGIAETIRENDLVKNESLTQLLLLREKNELLRISELKQQMNPHFIFNALNSIQSKILTDKKEEASKFLVSFSKLIRKNLEMSDNDFISLEDEFINLEHYLKIENMRLGDSFSYVIKNEEALNLAHKKIPTFLLQPLVENAIWHGFQSNHENNKLVISTTRKENTLYISITDNGIGINRSIESKTNTKHKSKGLKLIQERLELITNKAGKQFSIEIKDRSLEGEKGTEVILTLEL